MCSLAVAGVVTLVGALFVFDRSTSLFLPTALTGFLSILVAHIYFHLYNMSETARRIRILVELKKGTFGREKNYTPTHLLQVRMQRLVAMGNVDRVGERYVAKASVLLMVALLLKQYEKLIFPRRFAAPIRDSQPLSHVS
jgi:hypothetical protein